MWMKIGFGRRSTECGVNPAAASERRRGGYLGIRACY